MSDGQYWFFTMELVQGLNFLEYVRPGYHAKHIQSSKTPTLRKSPGASDSDKEQFANYEAETKQLDSIKSLRSGDDRPDQDWTPVLLTSP